MVVSVEAVSKDFGGLRALTDISLELRKGEILGLIGPNGSGKTTLINIVSGVIRPTSGRVRLAGTVLSSCPAYSVANYGVTRTFQNLRLFGDMTVLENVEVASGANEGHGRGHARLKAKEALRLLGIESLRDVPAKQLAHGLQRRVEIARAVGASPRFLLLDEPAAGLNETESDSLRVTISLLRDQVECGILVVDHDLRMIMRVADRIHVLNEGRSLAEGSPQEVREDPAVIRAYLGARGAQQSSKVEPSSGKPRPPTTH